MNILVKKTPQMRLRSLNKVSALPLLIEKINMRTRTWGNYCFAIVLGAAKCAPPSQTMGESV